MLFNKILFFLVLVLYSIIINELIFLEYEEIDGYLSLPSNSSKNNVRSIYSKKLLLVSL